MLDTSRTVSGVHLAVAKVLLLAGLASGAAWTQDSIRGNDTAVTDPIVASPQSNGSDVEALPKATTPTARATATSTQAMAAMAVTGEPAGLRLTEWVLPGSQGQGWNVDKALGRLSFAVPLAQMPGEVSFPIGFVMGGSFQAKVSLGLGTGDTFIKNEPIWGTINLGYIADGKYSLENGKTYLENEFTGNTTNMQAVVGSNGWISQGKLPLAKAFGFDWAIPSFTNGTWVINTQADLIRYAVASESMFGTTYGPLVAANCPTGFTILNDSDKYMVLMDKDIARVFIKIQIGLTSGTTANVWFPTLIVDRFGHYVTLKWANGTQAAPGYHYFSVKVLNQRNQGAVIRWGHLETANTRNELQDLARVDFINIAAPSMLIQGYPGDTGALPSGYQAPTYYAPGDSTNNSFRYGLGAVRPTVITVGDPTTLPQPSWSGVDPIVAPPATVSADAVPSRVWNIEYDGNNAEILSIKDSKGVKTTFLTKSYSIYIDSYVVRSDLVRGVYQANQVDESGQGQGNRVFKWDRIMPTSSAKNLITVVETHTESSASSAPSPDHSVEYVFGNPADRNVRDFSNAFLSKVTLKDASANVLETRTNTSKSTGGGLNGQLSMVETAITTRTNAVPVKQDYAYLTTNLLQVSKMTLFAANTAGIWFKAQEKAFTYDALWEMLDLHRVASTQTTRFDLATGTALSPGALTARQTWDQWNGAIPPKLQLLESYQEAGTLKHGSAYTYDGAGRLATQAVLHAENGATAASPNMLTVTYDSATGLPIAQATDYQEGSGTATLTKTQGNFDSGLRPTLLTSEQGVSTSLTYDLYGRPLTIAKDGEAAVSVSYPDEWSTVTTQAGKTATEYRDGFGRQIRTVRPDGTAMVPTYDLNGRVSQVRETNPAGVVRTSTTAYDLLDRVTSRTSVTGMREDFAYNRDTNLFNQVTQRVDPLGLNLATVTRQDPFGQVASVIAPNGDMTAFTHDGWGNKTQVIITPAGGGTPQIRSFAYDALGRLTSKTEPETGTQTFGNFNALNQAQTLTELGIDLSTPPRVRALVYDGLGRLRSQAGGNTIESFTYEGPFLMRTDHMTGSKAVQQTFAYEGPGKRLSQETTTAPLGQ